MGEKVTQRFAPPRALTVVLAAAFAVALVAPATGSAANPWTTPSNQFLNMAHQGGELEAPGNTLYAFKTALEDRGADAVEMDAYITSDGELVVNDEIGRDRERYKVPYGTVLSVADGAEVRAGQTVATGVRSTHRSTHIVARLVRPPVNQRAHGTPSEVSSTCS